MPNIVPESERPNSENRWGQQINLLGSLVGHLTEVSLPDAHEVIANLSDSEARDTCYGLLYALRAPEVLR